MGQGDHVEREKFYCRSSLEHAGFSKFIKSLGGDLDALAMGTDLVTKPDHSKIHYVNWSSICHLYEGAAQMLDEPNFGLKWALAMPEDFRNSGPHVYLLSVSSHIANFLDLAFAYQKIHCNAVSYSYSDDIESGEATGLISFHPLAEYSRQFCEQAMATIAMIAFRFVPNFYLKSVHFQHSAPDDLALFNKVFQCPVYFNCDANLIVADRKFLSVKKKNISNTVLNPLVKTFVNWRLARHKQNKSTVAMTLAEMIPSLLGIRKSDVESMSSVMNMSAKKLQRLLRDEGTTFSAVLDDVRKNLASHLLTQSDVSVAHIAKTLDYSSDRPFIAAFKRWYGTTPLKYRQSQSQD